LEKDEFWDSETRGELCQNIRDTTLHVQ